MEELIAEHRDLLDDGKKIVVDPSNQYILGPNNEFLRKLPEGQSSASMVVAMLPPGARYVKAFGTLVALPRLRALRIALLAALSSSTRPTTKAPPRQSNVSSALPGSTR